MTKKTVIIAIIIIAILLIIPNNKKMELKSYSIEDAKEAILKIEKKYGSEIAAVIEKMMRLETANFQSGQFIRTGTAGMEKGAWKNLPKGLSTIFLKDNQTKQVREFYVFPSVYSFAEYLVKYIERHKGNFARWNSTDKAKQTEYANRVNSIKSQFI